MNDILAEVIKHYEMLLLYDQQLIVNDDGIIETIYKKKKSTEEADIIYAQHAHDWNAHYKSMCEDGKTIEDASE